MTTTPGTEIVELADGVFARLHEGLTNAGILIGDESVLIVDSLRVPSFARDLIQDVRHLTDKPIQYVIEVTGPVTIETDAFRFAEEFRGMEIISDAGTVIGWDGDKEILTPYDDCVLIMPSRRLKKGESAVRFGRFTT